MRRMRNAKLGLAILGLSGWVAACGGTSERAPAAAEPGDAAMTAFSAPGGAFKIDVPAGWQRTWTASPSWDAPSELRLYPSGAAWPNDITFTVLHYDQAYRAPERFLFDQRRALSDRKDLTGTAEDGVTVAGRSATALEVKDKRYPPLGMSGDPVPSVVRHVVVPASRGFFVLRSDVPAGEDGRYRAVFDRFVASFAPADKDTPTAPDPVPPAEYEVYAALFASKAPGGIDAPQFFSAVLGGRLVRGSTLAIVEPLPAGWPGQDFGALGPGLAEDYRAKNRTAWPLTDRILVPMLRVIPPEELDSQLKAGMEGPGADARNLFGIESGYVTLSRVGFNAGGDQALLSAGHTSPGAMGTRYLVLMKKTGSVWRLEKVAMEDLWYH